MSVLNKNIFRLFCLISVLLMLAMSNARAALPDAGTSIGTQASVTFEVNGETDRSESNLVTTTIAQVYATSIAAFNGAVGKAGDEIDVRFAVRNIGNGPDEVALSISKLPKGVAKVALFFADANGVVDESSGTDVDGKFELTGLARDQVRNIVARVRVPDDALPGALAFELTATNEGKKMETASGTISIVDGKNFTVEAGNGVVLDEHQKTLLAFKVKGGADAGTGYFLMSVVKKSDPSTLVKYIVENQKIIFDGKDIAAGDIVAANDKVAFAVGAVTENLNTDFKMAIRIPDAKRGDEYLMFVEYAKTDADKLTKSNGLPIAYKHAMKKPALAIIGNSSDASSKSSTIASALSGDSVDYTLTLKNESTLPENFSLELSGIANAGAIRNVTIVDENGNKLHAASGSGLPETGVIPAQGTITFKVKIALAHGITVDTAPQKFKLTAKSITEPKTGAVEQDFNIVTVVAAENASITFFSDEERLNRVTELDVGDIAEFTMEVAMPDQGGKLPRRDYRIAFDLPNATFQMFDGNGALGAPMSAMDVRLGSGDKAGRFLVKVNMHGQDTLTPKAIVTDILTGKSETAKIVLNKLMAIGFVELGYAGKGSPDLDTALILNVLNHGRSLKDGEYEIAAVPKQDWHFTFSIDGKTWQEALPLQAMAVQEKQAVHVKIRVPKNVKAGAIELLKLVLRKPGQDVDEASTVVTLSIGKSKLLVSKAVAVVKKSKGTSAPAPAAFVKDSTEPVENGDSIWYRVTVTNPIDAPAAKNVTVTDPLPKFVTFAQADGSNATNDANGVKLQIGDMQPGQSETLQYRVTVELH